MPQSSQSRRACPQERVAEATLSLPPLVPLYGAFDPATNCEPRFCSQMLSLLFALHASVTQLAPLHHRTKAVGLYAAVMTVE